MATGQQISAADACAEDVLASVATMSGFYLGNGQFIHAPQPGDVVSGSSFMGSMPADFAPIVSEQNN